MLKVWIFSLQGAECADSTSVVESSLMRWKPGIVVLKGYILQPAWETDVGREKKCAAGFIEHTVSAYVLVWELQVVCLKQGISILCAPKMLTHMSVNSIQEGQSNFTWVNRVKKVKRASANFTLSPICRWLKPVTSLEKSIPKCQSKDSLLNPTCVGLQSWWEECEKPGAAAGGPPHLYNIRSSCKAVYPRQWQGKTWYDYVSCTQSKTCITFY